WLTFFLLSVTKGISQNSKFFSIAIDPKMMLKGPYPTSKNGELDLLVRIGKIHDEHHEYGFLFETFPATKYTGYGGFYYYTYLIKNKRKGFNSWEFATGPEIGLIHRNLNGDKHMSSLFLALNGETRYFFSSKWGILFQANLRIRSDLKEIYGEDNIFRFNGAIGLICHW
ncbi:hypothetical protein ACFLRU_05485, partial [Bacteroidota bacterium]